MSTVACINTCINILGLFRADRSQMETATVENSDSFSKSNISQRP